MLSTCKVIPSVANRPAISKVDKLCVLKSWSKFVFSNTTSTLEPKWVGVHAYNIFYMNATPRPDVPQRNLLHDCSEHVNNVL